MNISPLAGKLAPASLLINLHQLERDYYERHPHPDHPGERVSFGTSGHRGTPLNGSFTETHILVIAQAICDYRRAQGIHGPVFMGKDTHAASRWAEQTALEVFAANELEVRVQTDGDFTPTPAISLAILEHNRQPGVPRADGVIITPSHNPPADGGIKYNPPNGGPADNDITKWIENRANELLKVGNSGVKRMPYAAALKAPKTRAFDYITPYVEALSSIIDMEAIRASGIAIGVDPLGGASLPYWEPIKKRYGLNLTVVNDQADPTFSFMTVDHDGKIRMDCSSGYAMASLVGLKDRFDIAFGTDPDSDRHGIVTPSSGLMNPNHYLAVAIRYLLNFRPEWPVTSVVGKTLVSSSLIDRVVNRLHRRFCEVPVGFKWFAPGLFDGSFCFGGEESAGASFLRKNGTVWTTDKDGILLCLLAAEILAKTGRDPGAHYLEITSQLGTPHYRRLDAPADAAMKAGLLSATPDAIPNASLAGEPIREKLIRAPGNQAAIGGIKVVTENGWFAGRPSGTENIIKLYAESFKGESHLDQIIREAGEIMKNLAAAK
jgi:phosphoglucomutase